MDDKSFLYMKTRVDEYELLERQVNELKRRIADLNGGCMVQINGTSIREDSSTRYNMNVVREEMVKSLTLQIDVLEILKGAI